MVSEEYPKHLFMGAEPLLVSFLRKRAELELIILQERRIFALLDPV